MRKAIVQYYIDPRLYSNPDYNQLSKDQNALANISSRSFEKYSEKIGADFHHITKPKLNYLHPTFERFDLWLDDKWWQQYDQIMYVDSDVFALPDAPDIFEKYPDIENFKVCESKSWQKTKSKQKGLLKDKSVEEINKYGFQTGVFILNQHVAEIMRPWISKYKQLDDHDGNILNWCTIESRVPIKRMDWRFNFKKAYFNNQPPVYFFHAQGLKKDTHEKRITSWLKAQGLT